MRITGILIAAAIAGAPFSAAAHPGAALLTSGASSEGTATTAGVAYSTAGGVHVYRGKRAEAAIQSDDYEQTRQIETEIEQKIIWRRLRNLRTQGFYTGDQYPSRRYTQGFYSGR